MHLCTKTEYGGLPGSCHDQNEKADAAMKHLHQLWLPGLPLLVQDCHWFVTRQAPKYVGEPGSKLT